MYLYSNTEREICFFQISKPSFLVFEILQIYIVEFNNNFQFTYLNNIILYNRFILKQYKKIIFTNIFYNKKHLKHLNLLKI